MRRPLLRSAGVLALVLALSGFASLEALFAPAAVLLERWTAHDPASTDDIDHGPWDRFLAAYVAANTDGVNRMAYGSVSEADRKALDAYIGGLAAVPISRYSRPRQMAYWINLYNALTVRLILDHYPVRSIRDISASCALSGATPASITPSTAPPSAAPACLDQPSGRTPWTISWTPPRGPTSTTPGASASTATA